MPSEKKNKKKYLNKFEYFSILFRGLLAQKIMLNSQSMNKIANANRLVSNFCRSDIKKVSCFKTMAYLRNESQAFILVYLIFAVINNNSSKVSLPDPKFTI